MNAKFKNFLKDKSNNAFFCGEIIQFVLKKINDDRELIRLLFIIYI